MKKVVVFGLCAALACFGLLPEVFSATEGGKYSRFMTPNLKKELGNLKASKRTYGLPSGLSQEETRELMGTMDQMMAEVKRKGGRPGLADAVKMWESMTDSDKQMALSGRAPAGVAPVAAAVVGAAMLGYVVARDLGRLAGKKKLQERVLSTSELDFVNGLKEADFGGRQVALSTSAADLDYAFR